jgi:predicted MPP superfamily phosphohydrolase
MRIFFLLAIMFGLDIYAFQAVRHSTEGLAPAWRSGLHIAYWALSIFAITFVLLAFSYDLSRLGRSTLTLLRAFIFILYLSKLVVVVFLFIEDLRRLLSLGYHKIAGGSDFDPSRKDFLTNLSLIMGGVPLTALSYGIIRNPYRYKVYREEIAVEGLPKSLDGLKVVQISDIHSGSFFLKEPIKRAIELINQEEPDLVFFTGDMVNSQATEMEPYMDIFDKIESRYGVYSVRGNHDYGDYHRWGSDEKQEANKQRFEEIQAEMGWDLLKNEHRILDIKGEKVGVIGIENMSDLPQFPKYGDLAKAKEGLEDVSLQLLLSHDPTYWKSGILKDFKDVDITFSGHTHGFQFGIEIPGLIRWSPSQLVYKEWAGLYQEGSQYLYVNRGLGFLGYPGRVGILPEVTSMVIKSK